MLQSRLIGRQHLKSMIRTTAKMADGRSKKDAQRGLIDAARRTRTASARAVKKQAGFKRYGDVREAIFTRNVSPLVVEIGSVQGGQPVEEYKGLRSMKAGGAAARRIGGDDTGNVRSGVWNNPRVFKRSFAANGGFFAVLPGQSKRAPRVLWTYGSKPDQPRDSGGRFASSGRTYGPVRRLLGPAVNKELVKDDSLRTFRKTTGRELKLQVGKRMSKLMRF
ncbi:hypothetical protein B7H23_12900 [Notoacmeibacter marinus]|uniref:Uncharacterized protein n=1 Tax=Notoacmeibacter marinus TaxID=1876515 RepID=A0A231UT32_9HYPH|nr:hypothetical protein [Notoacmeibacter marinus]OXS99097.1 hypothetical protein B7H23_12900 [Notoacmeibacter marinus]